MRRIIAFVLINALIVAIPPYLMMVFLLGRWVDASMIGPLLIVEGMFFIGVILSLTHMGKKTMIKQMKLVAVDTFPHKEYVIDCVQDVLAQYQAVKHKTMDLEIYMVKQKGINAVAFGWNCLAIYPELLTLEKQEVEAIIAHELGHIVHKDSVLLQLNYVANNVFLIFGYVINAIIYIMISFTQDKDGKITNMLSRFITFIFYGFIVRTTQYIMEIIYKKVMRNNEFYADYFACDIGYKAPLLSIVSRLDSKRDQREKSTQPKVLIALKGIYDTHPSNAKRKKAIASY